MFFIIYDLQEKSKVICIARQKHWINYPIIFYNHKYEQKVIIIFIIVVNDFSTSHFFYISIWNVFVNQPYTICKLVKSQKTIRITKLLSIIFFIWRWIIDFGISSLEEITLLLLSPSLIESWIFLISNTS